MLRSLLRLNAGNACNAVKVLIPTVDLYHALCLHVEGIEGIRIGDILLYKNIQSCNAEVFRWQPQASQPKNRKQKVFDPWAWYFVVSLQREDGLKNNRQGRFYLFLTFLYALQKR